MPVGGVKRSARHAGEDAVVAVLGRPTRVSTKTGNTLKKPQSKVALATLLLILLLSSNATQQQASSSESSRDRTMRRSMHRLQDPRVDASTSAAANTAGVTQCVGDLGEAADPRVASGPNGGCTQAIRPSQSPHAGIDTIVIEIGRTAMMLSDHLCTNGLGVPTTGMRRGRRSAGPDTPLVRSP